MLSFKQMLPLMEQTEQNKHLDHIEDLMLLRGGSGLDNAIAFLKDIVQSLKTGSTTMGMSTKWDGKPAVICGINPENKKFFVAIKGVFGKQVQKVFHTEEEIRKGFDIKDLADKLVQCLKYLPKIGIKTVLQGDLMFTADGKKNLTIGGKPHIGFQPNTILYTVPTESEIGKRIAAAKIGITFHTEYSGKTLADLKATTFNFNASKLKQNPDVWFTDPNIYDLTPALMKGGEGDMALRSITECEALAKKVKPFLKPLLARKDLMPLMLPYINSTINGGMTSFSTNGLKLYVKTKLEKELNKLKTEKGRQAKEAAMNDILAFIDAYEGQFTAMFELHNKIAKVKEMILGKMYAVSALGHFFVDADGIRPTDPEGIVIVRTGTAVKLVNRLRFSRQNRKVNES
jgi:hypothetical protein